MKWKTWLTIMLFGTKVLFGEFNATIPVLDLEEYFHPETKEKFLQELYQGFKEVGFVAVVNTGIDPAILDNAYSASYEFFHQPFDQKMTVFDPEKAGERGYTAGEATKGHTELDFKEFYSIGREVDPEKNVELGLWENIWPQTGSFEEAVKILYAELDKYKRILECAIAEAIRAPFDLFSQKTENGDTLLRALHYPASPGDNQIWAADHTDSNLFTILPAPSAEGLQIRGKDGQWIKVKTPKDAFILNVGDMLENITNGEFKSVVHRVVATNDGYERFSFVYFVHPRSEERLDPLAECIARTGGVRKYPYANRIEILEEALVNDGLASDAMIEHLAESGFVDRLIETKRASLEVMELLEEKGLASELILEELKRIRS